ncbi:MAG: metal ABC transporter substrate-binding protein [Solirubrobacteraceae bacterium]
MRAAALVLTAGLIAGAAAGCGNQMAGAGGRPAVVATTTQVADLVRAVGGSAVDVRQILRPNSDPHEYEPRPADAKAIASAALVIRSGGDVDRWLDDLIANAGGSARVVTLADGIAPVRTAEGVDPHWWQDPRNAERAVAATRQALSAADPSGRAAFAANATRYLRRVRAMDRAIAACFARVPRAQRTLVTDHDALGYFARRYGLRIVGTVLPSLSTQAQPSAGGLARLTRDIRRAGVKAVFPEQSLNPKLVRAIAAQSGAAVGRPLWADALGPPGSDGATYLGSLRSNANALADGLSGGTVRCVLPAA